MIAESVYCMCCQRKKFCYISDAPSGLTGRRGTQPHKSKGGIYILLKRTDITRESWLNQIAYLKRLINNTEESYADCMGKPYESMDGLFQIPLTNKEWAKWVGYEHDEQTLWFKPIMKKSKNGFLVRGIYGPKSAVALVRALTWNASLYIHYLNKPIAHDAVIRAAKNSMEWSSCPVDLVPDVIKTIEELCIKIISAVSKDNGEINRASLQFLKTDIGEKLLGRRTCVNHALRKNICNQLIVNGIATMRTRLEQQILIRNTLKNVDALKSSAVRAIERMLTMDKNVLKMTGGLSILLPYTKEEKTLIYKKNRTDKTKTDTNDRVMEIYEKLANGEKLNATERKFKSRHKELFSKYSAISRF